LIETKLHPDGPQTDHEPKPEPGRFKKLAALLAKTAPLAAAGKCERFKTSADFDGTARHPEWLG
jgi:hypothetical protein